MLTLVQYPPALGLRSASPFCLKAEALLRHSGLAYRVEPVDNPSAAPKKKLPVLRDGDRVIADSHFIRLHLETVHGVVFDVGLDPAERALSHALITMCEERLYWVGAYARWMEEGNWPVARDALFASVPWLIRPFVAARVRGTVRQALHAHGIGRHSRDEVFALGARDVHALASQLGDAPFMMGQQRTAVDATAYGFLAEALLSDRIRSPLQDTARAHPNLVAYLDRLQASYFGEA